MSQLSVAEQGVGLKGMKFDINNDQMISRETEVDLDFGDFVVVSVANPDERCKKPTLVGEVASFKKVLGVAIRSHTSEGTENIKAGDVVSIMKQGRCYIECQEAFSNESDIYVGFQNGEEGQFFVNASANREQITGARIMNSGLANELAILDFGL